MDSRKYKYIFSFMLALALISLIISGCSNSSSQSVISPQADKYTGNLQVKVTDPSGKPLPGAKVVSNEQPDSQLKVTGLTDANGMVIFKDIKSGDYKFYISRFDYVQKNDIEVTVTPGQTASLTINMTGAEQTQ